MIVRIFWGKSSLKKKKTSEKCTMLKIQNFLSMSSERGALQQQAKKGFVKLHFLSAQCLCIIGHLSISEEIRARVPSASN